ncbi:MAG: alpha/beta hydrolase [Deltaproteobacteria bacterium]|nr:alpha/beta hydrolase [Deltaproteobacteria bacterium]
MVSITNVTLQRENASAGSGAIERVTLASRRGVRLAGLLHLPVGATDLRERPTVVLCHGMESTKEGTKHHALAGRLGALGYACLRFDFSYVGESEGIFEDLTISGEVDDLAGACAGLRGRGARDLVLVGSSLGGTVALLYAATDPDVRALVTIAAVSRPLGIVERLGPEAVGAWRRNGYREEATGRLKCGFLDDLAHHDVLAAARALRAATLVTHGDLDDIVPVADAHALYAALPAPKALAVTPGCDHRYSDPVHLEALLARTVAWIATHLPAADRRPRAARGH